MLYFDIFFLKQTAKIKGNPATPKPQVVLTICDANKQDIKILSKYFALNCFKKYRQLKNPINFVNKSTNMYADSIFKKL